MEPPCKAASPSTEVESAPTDTEKTSTIQKAPPFVSTFSQWLGLFTSAITIFPLISVFLLRYASLGRSLYFDFDLNYYDFFLTNTTILLFALFAFCGVAAILLATLVRFIWCKFSFCIEKKAKHRLKKVLFAIVLVLFTFFGIAFTVQFLYPASDTAALLGAITFTFFIIMYMVLFNLQLAPAANSKTLKVIILFIAVLLTIVTTSLLKQGYSEAKEQLKFPIIISATDKSQHYVIISEGKTMYSAYLCQINVSETDNSTLTIITDQHKYFKIDETHIEFVAFDNVKLATSIPIAASTLT